MDHAAELQAVYRQRALFFAEAGKCILEYQKVEDFIESVFVAALGNPPEKASGIFAVARGLEAKFAIVTAALCDADEPLRKRWAELRKRIAKAAENRNQIAHATPVSTSDPIVITMNPVPGEQNIISGGGNSRTEARKETRSGYVTWTQQLLNEEFLRSFDLSRALIAFTKQLRGEVIPPHLQNL